MKTRRCITMMVAVSAVATLACGQAQTPAAGTAPAPAQGPQSATPVQPWVDSFDLAQCTQMTTGRNAHFILEPGYQLVLANNEEQVFITVLAETKVVNGVEARVIEEREFANGRLKEVSRNYFTICKEHNDVFYLGEEVDIYANGRVKEHSGAWLAGDSGARAGLVMPGTPALGYRHYQEVAPGVAMDRGEIAALDAIVECPGGEFRNCVKVEETSELEPGDTCIKIYAPGVGLVYDDGMVLIDSGTRRTPPRAPIALPAGIARSRAEDGNQVGGENEGENRDDHEVEIQASEMPVPVAATIRRLHPEGRIREVKRESHEGGREIYAIEVMIGEEQYDVELAPDGAVIRDEKE